MLEGVINVIWANVDLPSIRRVDPVINCVVCARIYFCGPMIADWPVIIGVLTRLPRAAVRYANEDSEKCCVASKKIKSFS